MAISVFDALAEVSLGEVYFDGLTRCEGLGLAILSLVIGGLITNNPGRAWRVLAEPVSLRFLLLS